MEITPWTIVMPEPKTWDTKKDTLPGQTSDSLVEPQQPIEVVHEPERVTVQEQVPEQTLEQKPEPEPQPQPKSVVENSDANIRIIAGCFTQEDNAARLANALKDKGYAAAFYELRGNKWYVSFGRYATDEEATTALREIRANTEYKAWILK